MIRSIHQRQRTIYRVTESIVHFRRDFLDHGLTHLKPLVLRDVADEIRMHECTVNRAIESPFSVSVPDILNGGGDLPIKLVGFFDLVERDEQGTYLISELKTS